MSGENDASVVGTSDLVVVLVGLTAGGRKRRRARRYFTGVFGRRAFLPWIPYVFGLRASAAWVSWRMKRRLSRGGHGRVHLVAYIGGGVIVRLLHARGQCWPIGRAVWDRSPTQESVAPALAARLPALLLTLLGFRAVLDLSRIDLAGLPFPECPQGAGLIVETRRSALARRLGIPEGPPGVSPDAFREMVPGARAAVALPLSHDEVYEDLRFLEEAASFLRTGTFRAPQAVILR